MNKSEIVLSLRNAYSKATGKSSGSIKLPTSVDLEINNGVLRIKINKINTNMQSDDNAFESWAIILKSWLPDEILAVVLVFDISDREENLGHYNRFLYRVNAMERMYDWFSVETSKKIEVDKFSNWLANTTCAVNVPSKDSSNKPVSPKSERAVETWFVKDDKPSQLNRRTGTEVLFNQLPVGLFESEVKTVNSIFTRGASAIDIWGIETQKILHIFELKCGVNDSAGIISETCFYANLLKDLYIDKSITLNKAKKSVERGFDLLYTSNFNQMKVHYLVEKLHPLIDERVIGLIQKGYAKIQIDFDVLYYSFSNKVVF